jgi:hypothetical protein
MFSIPPKDTPASPWPILERLLRTHDELAELKDMLDAGVTLAFLLRGGEWRQGSRSILGACCMPGAGTGALQGLLLQLLDDTLGYDPTYVVVLNEDWWSEATPLQREALVFHEVLHCEHAKDQYGTPRYNKITGLPVPGTRAHSLEEFQSVVERYGSWSPDIAEFLAAAARHVPPSPPAPAAPEEDVF